MKKEIYNEWEKDFDKLNYCPDWDVLDIQLIKAFIHQLLSSERQRLREEIEGMRQLTPYTFEIKKDKTMEDVVDSYNQALSDILKLLEE